ncbi:hypothetical protein P154DRAFT_262496 [Amniculicola lignicola CBS 123094]|uniref:Uncharacterized protein n=1 Tax=Amniculicola lignicola CBS 123094 TaxID=1392246 RepID=A0A6A5WBZ3_9PLEO|nr:hypothetical protein P154DRAFT_262496 [Amniculicola lignicola CBS 123094]
MKLRLLTGAPLSAHLDFREESLSPREELVPAVKAFLHAELEPGPEPGASHHVKWRRLNAASTKLRTGWSQPYLPGGDRLEGTSSFSFSMPEVESSSGPIDEEQDSTLLDPTLPDLDSDFLSQTDAFLEHSLILHDSLLSSQIAIDMEVDHTVSSASLLTSFNSFNSFSTEFSDDVESQGPSIVLQLPDNLAITSLDHLPTANHLRSILPQTPTPTFICVLTSAPERREVLVKKGNYKMHLFEITVADDTQSNFSVTFWFRPANSSAIQSAAQANLRKAVEQVKVGDILLLRNIVLNTYRDGVYGQSLNGSIVRARTTIEVLMSRDGLVQVHHIVPVAAEEKFVKVKKWAKTHVATEYALSRKRKTGAEVESTSKKRVGKGFDYGGDSLPPDTLEAV